ncbi:MAG TPA: ComEC/Rec2 family competence protein, partial [Cytophagales bacterium]|nr:ComEC/Rec2 family competence protein [Cytophagales bacterium]
MRPFSFIRYLHNTPFLRYLLFWTTGILLYLLAIPWPYLLGALAMGISLLIVLYQQSLVHHNTVLLAGAHVLLCGASYALCAVQDDTTRPHFVGNQTTTKYYQVVVTNIISPERYQSRVLACYTNHWMQSSGGVNLTIKGGCNYSLYDTLYIQGSPTFISAPKNPEEFNYVQYYRGKGIQMQDFVQIHQIVAHRVGRGLSIKRVAHDMRTYLASRLRKHISDPEIASVAEALILGVRTEINKELTNAYSMTGTIHVLAVSGMHVGLLFGLVTWLFATVLGTKHRLLYSLIGLGLLWFYALVTGMSASVVRASAMYTVFQVGILLHQKVNLANTLFSSSFIILLIEPLMLLDIGFQLSFFAVCGIALFQPLFEHTFNTKNLALKALKDLITVSISAQMGVLPLSLYYFKQFPNLFIISNILIITLSTIALYIGLLCLTLIGFDVLLSKFCNLLSALIKAMNDITVNMSKLP